jgi:hypothetical protein
MLVVSAAAEAADAHFADWMMTYAQFRPPFAPGCVMLRV